MIKFHTPYKSKRLKRNLIKLSKQNSFNSTYFRDACVEILESKFKYKNFLLTNSATSALEISAIMLKDENRFDEVLMPSYTFSSTANAFLRANHKIKFVDIDIENLMIDVNKINKINENQLLAIVHYAGSSFNFDKLTSKFGNDVSYIEDAAQSFGTEFNNKMTGTFGLFGCISFHPTKNLHAGFGGMLIVDKSMDFDKAKFIYERGTDRSKVISGLQKKYEWVEVGSSFEITELSSAVLESQLYDYEKIIGIREELYNTYLHELNELVENKLIRIQNISKEINPNYHSFYIIINKNIEDFLDNLNTNHNIQAYVGYVPLHSSKYGKKLGLNNSLETTENIGEKVVRLPLHTELKISEVKKISKSVIECID